MQRYDVLVLGAGAAGLAAARELAAAGLSLAVLEARDRIGGRIFTRFDARSSRPMELGAEFIHGNAEVTFSLLQKIGASAVGEGGSPWERHGGELQSAGDDPFESLPALLGRVDMRGPDRSVDEFLAEARKDPAFSDVAGWMRMLVEGFDAADPAQAGIQEIAQEWNGQAGLEAAQYRPSCGYAEIADALAASLPPGDARVMLQTVVEEIAWERGNVRMRARSHGQVREFTAKRAVVTLPIGVLHGGTVVFKPELPGAHREALAKIAMGPVTKAVFRFGRPFWQELQNGRLRDASFLFNRDGYFPTFWTTYPIVSPIVVAWAGGPRSERLAGLDEAAIVRLAAQEFGALVGVAPERVHAELEAAHTHDWQSDPYALGAYSYLRTGGLGARKILARPIDDALYLAGEGTAEEGEGGTVAGALQSGIAAAAAIVATARA